MADHRRQPRGHDGEQRRVRRRASRRVSTPARASANTISEWSPGKAYEGYVWANPLDGSAEIEVTLVWGEGDADRTSTKNGIHGAGYSKKLFSFTSSRARKRLCWRSARSPGTGEVLLGPPSLMPADNVHGMRADTLALLKQLDAAVYRWPGGNFVSGYDWRDGIGDRDRRPPRKNPAWTGVEHNDFGTDEIHRVLPRDQRRAARRGQHRLRRRLLRRAVGRVLQRRHHDPRRRLAGEKRPRAPYGVKFWCVGNEMFGALAARLHADAPLHAEAQHRRRGHVEGGPDAQLIAVGDLDQVNTEYDPSKAKPGKTCTRIMLEDCADHMSILSEHFYDGRVPWTKEGATTCCSRTSA